MRLCEDEKIMSARQTLCKEKQKFKRAKKNRER